MIEKEIKQFPIFWTFIKKNGVTSIHQVMFLGLYVNAYTELNGNGRVTTIEKAIFKIAGRSDIFIGGVGRTSGQGIADHPSSDGRKKYFSLNSVYATKEDAIKASKEPNPYKTNPTEEFHHLYDETYTITKHSPLFELGSFSWENNVPSNMKLKTNEKGNTYLCGWRSNGLEVGYYRVRGKDKVQVIEGETIHNVSDHMIFDMVSREWVNQPQHDYYASKEECEEMCPNKVYVF